MKNNCSSLALTSGNKTSNTVRSDFNTLYFRLDGFKPSSLKAAISKDLRRELKKRAEEHHRSLNREILAAFQSATNQSLRLEPGTLIREARAARKKFGRPVSPAEIKA